MDKSRKRLFSNTVYLYIMQLATQILNLVTIPYLTRVLGPTVYGKIGLAVGYMTYVTLILDFGFLLSATQEVSEHKEDKAYISGIFTSVLIVKLVLAFIIAAVFVIFGKTGVINEKDIPFYIIYLIAYVVNALLPDFFYRGVEDMKIISVRTVVIKAVFAGLIFVLVKGQSDYFFVPISLLAGNIIAVLVSYFDVYKRYRITFKSVSSRVTLSLVRKSTPFFVSRFSATFYQALNVIILGRVYGDSPVVGYYTSSDKFITLVKTGSSPIADSLYPYMLNNRDFRLIKKIFKITVPAILLCAVFAWTFSEQICVIAFGAEYRDAGNILRCLLPIAVVILPSYILAFPVLSPMGLAKYANMSNIIGMCIQLVGLLALSHFKSVNVYNLCILTSITEVSVFLFRLIIVLVNKDRLKKTNDTQ